MMDKSERIKDLVELLNKANKAYYQEANEIMTNFEYDKLYDELVGLEKETGMVLSNSPTVNVGYQVVSQLPKEQHNSPMLSLDKTKEVGALADFAGDRKCLLSWKMDGLTVVLTYENGELVKAVTRGNGLVGEVITNNAKTFKNIPISIPYKGRLTLRGEAIIKYSDFEQINREIEDADSKYKNPRNLCSGSVRQLNSQVTAERNVNFVAFALINADDVDFGNSIEQQYKWMESQGFQVVEYRVVTRNSMEDAVKYFAEKIQTYDYPSDGLVLMFDDIEYGLSLGTTAKFPRNGIAFKWEDEQAETTLKYIEWSPSRTGLINPVAVFEPVELEGTTVSRASVHNISIMEELELGSGDRIKVYKANMIIPQISENLTKSGIDDLPKECPVCGHATEVKAENGIKTLYCPNSQCPAKHVKLFTLFVSRNGMNIDGLSEETLEKFIDAGYIKEFADIFHLDRYYEEIVATPGFGQKSYDNLMDSVEKARNVELSALIYSLGIPNIGSANAKLICKAFNNNIEKIRNASVEELIEIDGIGEIMAEKFCQYFADEDNIKKLDNLLKEVNIAEPEENTTPQNMDGLTFVITGSVEHFANRNELKSYIEKHGGKVTGSVSAKTNYLINNDAMSASSKNKKAKQLGVEIVTEEVFLERWCKDIEQ
ncbi:NAD-dependent DNA ligase LigA [Eubacterium ventriosum]|uniref:DNA ligase n=2 Tax=Eubacterium ventriosum TaxID=39496 RepID=A0A413R7N8_9FIRM|nr:NAD-dependent DNA ligase LigA [Eubacterium ventriosum]RHA80222.1 NAD-dependent DNA ligase LigA [Eubacterium ventriosum]RHB15684.1 NAD-dependent DNA ligase LigA [Eubacterium ventriosum]RHF88191.1 NAD-dependent DNA ligase LigA [Eubacterium ventriosum]